jgi:hypothetical protein
MVEGRYPGACGDEVAPKRSRCGAHSADLANSEVSAGKGRLSVAKLLAGLDGRHKLAAFVARLKPQQLAERGRSKNSVDRESSISLKLAEGICSGVSKYAVDAASVETQRSKPLLQLSNVIATQHWAAPVEKTISERPAGFDQHVPGLLSADPVDAQTSSMLKGLDGHTRGSAIGA